MNEEAPDQPQSAGDEIDKLYDSLTSAEPERPMEAEQAPEQQQEAAPAPEPVWNGTEWEFEWNGRKIAPESRDRARQWMSQGYNYAQRMGELNKQRGEWEQKLADYESKLKGYSRYDEIDRYARENPQWWEHVEQTWTQRAQQQQQLDPNLKPLIDPIQQELSSIKEFVEQIRAERAQAEEKQADAALDAEISEIRKQYPNIDLASVDESGKPLERRILEHAREIGTSSFRAAFRDYLFDKLRTLEGANAKEAAVKAREQQVKRGIIGQSPTPAKRPEIAPYQRGKSYDNLAQEALRELRESGSIS